MLSHHLDTFCNLFRGFNMKAKLPFTNMLHVVCLGTLLFGTSLTFPLNSSESASFRLIALTANVTNNRTHLQVGYESRDPMVVTWSGFHRDESHHGGWFVPFHGHPMAYMQNVSLGKDGRIGFSELTFTDTVPSQVAFSVIAQDASLYFYRKLYLAVGDHTNLVNHETSHDRVLQKFPATKSFRNLETIEVSFSIAVARNGNVERRFQCYLLQYLESCSNNCIVKKYLYDSDKDAFENSLYEHIKITYTVTNLAKYEDNLNLTLLVSNANPSHQGRYVCNMFTEPDVEGANIHTQMKLVHSRNYAQEDATEESSSFLDNLVDETHEFQYKEIEENHHHSLLPSSFLDVQFLACGNSRIQPQVFSNITALKSGVDNCLICYASSHPPFNVTILFNGQEVQNDRGYLLREPSRDPEYKALALILRNVSYDDAGIYTCYVSTETKHLSYNLGVQVY